MHLTIFTYRSVTSALLAVIFTLSACSNKKDFNNESGLASVEARNAQSEEDVVLIDINQALSAQGVMRGRTADSSASVFGKACGYNVDTASAPGGLIRIYYDGSLCGGRIREGSITLTVQDFPASRLKTAGSKIKIEFNAYKVTKTTHGNTLQFDGTATLTNQSGGSWYDLVFLNQSSLVQAITASDLKLTVNSSATMLYTISRSRTYTFANGIVSCSAKGIGAHNGKTGVDAWGYTSQKNEFTSQITAPVVWTSACGALFPLSGVVTVRETGKEFDLECMYGVDDAGNPSLAACPFGFKTKWTYKSDTRSLVFGYDN